MRTTTAFGLLFALAACGAKTASVPQASQLPPMQLVPLQAELQKLAAAGPAPPTPAHLAALVDLGVAAFTPGGDTRLAARSRAELLAEKDAFWALEQLLAHETPEVRSQAAFELGKLGVRASWVPLLMREKYETKRPQRVWVADALARLGNGIGLLDLIDAMDVAETAETAGAQAIEILRRARRDPGDQPSYRELQIELQALFAEWQLTGYLAPDCEESKPDPLMDARIAARLTVLEAFDLRPVDDTRFVLSRAGRVGLPFLRRAVKAQEKYLRTHALEVLRLLGPVAADLAPDVLPLLADPLNRVEAAQALRELHAASALPFLRTWLRDPDIELRSIAAGALGKMGDRDSAPLLDGLLRDEQQPMDVRVQAAFSLALFERERPAFRFLQQRVGRGDYHVPTANELLDHIASWPDDRVREVVGKTWHLEYVGGPDEKEVRTAAETVLADAAPAGVPPVADRLALRLRQLGVLSATVDVDGKSAAFGARTSHRK